MNEQKHVVNLPLFQIEGVDVVFVREGHIKDGECHANLYYYDMRHNDVDWSEPCTLENIVVVNFFGTLVTTAPIPTLAKDVDAWIELEQELIDLILENRD